MRVSIFGMVLLLFLAGCQDAGVAGRCVEDVSPEVAFERILKGKAVLVDVREPEEWEETGVAGPAYLLSLSDLRGERRRWDPFLLEHGISEILLYCRSGNRSGIAAEILAEEGFKVGNVGGFRDWRAAELPVREADEERLREVERVR